MLSQKELIEMKKNYSVYNEAINFIKECTFTDLVEDTIIWLGKVSRWFDGYIKQPLIEQYQKFCDAVYRSKLYITDPKLVNEDKEYNIKLVKSLQWDQYDVKTSYSKILDKRNKKCT